MSSLSKFQPHAIVAGSFDPFTLGHLDLVQRAVRLFDRVVVLVARSPSKTPLLQAEDRVALINRVLRRMPKARAVVWDGLVVDYAKRHRIKVLVRGLRAGGDFESEFTLAKVNQDLSPDLDTVFLVTAPSLGMVSSSMIRELLSYGKNVSKYVPAEVARALAAQSRGSRGRRS